jgi:hypothetical protein
MTFQDVRSEGVTFKREIDMKTGWIYRMVGPYTINGHTVYPSLGFHNDVLQRMSLSFVHEEGSLAELRDLHDTLLRQELGIPSTSNPHVTTYGFAWGEISSETDPRGGTAQIVMSQHRSS